VIDAYTQWQAVNDELSGRLQLAQMDTGVTVIFCVLTVDTLEQAIDRAGLKGGNKGFEAGLAAIEMGRLAKKLEGAGSKDARASAAPKKKGRRG